MLEHPGSKVSVRRRPRALGLRTAALAASVAALLLGAVQVSVAEPLRRVALVVGNGDYRGLPDVPGAAGSAERVRDFFQRAGFDVVFGTDLDKAGLEATVRRFIRSLGPKDAAVLYYSGHAVQVGGRNYIVPVDAALDSAYDLEVESQSLSNLLSYLEKVSALQVTIIDAAHASPLDGKSFAIGAGTTPLASGPGLAAIEPGAHGVVLLSAAPGQVMDAGADSGIFSEVFLTHAATPNLDIAEVISRTRRDVAERSAGRLEPWDANALDEEFHLLRRRMLLIVDDRREIRAEPGQAEVALGIPVPLASGGGEPSVYFTRLPEEGGVFVSGRAVERDTPVPASEIVHATYRPGSDMPDEVTIGYRAVSTDGLAAESLVAVRFGAPDAPVTPMLQISGASDEVEREPVRLAYATQAGADFANVMVDAERVSALSEAWLRIESASPNVQIAVGDSVLGEGDLVQASELAQLRVRPSLSITDGEAEVKLVPAIDRPEIVPSLTIDVAVALNRCDELAAEPFDLQGVTEGVLPNEIDVAAARQACEEAVRQHADTPRFRFQLARALYAQGEFAGAADALKAAYEAGHTRAGQLLGRLHQLGAGVERDPAKAIPLFEAGAARGDAYAQNWLAKALLEGNGVAADSSRAIALYSQAAEAGHTYAMNGLGAAYLYGRGVQKDAARALRFFEASAAREDVWGFVNMGVMYRDGEAVEKDRPRAREFFVRAHENGHPYAATALGLMAREDGEPPAAALAWFRQSAERGDAWGALHAGNILRNDPSLAADEGESLRLLALAASHEFGPVTERARPALDQGDGRLVRMEAQKALQRLGADIGAIDGVIGAKSREAADAILGTKAPPDSVDLLIALLRKEWLDARPRLDML